MREYLVEGFGRYLQLEFKNVMNEDGKISRPCYCYRDKLYYRDKLFLSYIAASNFK